MVLRKCIFWIHLVAGLTSGLVILSMAGSGILIAFESQICDFAERKQQHVPVFPDEKRKDLEFLLKAVNEFIPDKVPQQMTLSSDPTSSIIVQFGRNEGMVYLHPYTGEILGGRSKVRDLMLRVEQWHRWLGSKEIGKPITGTACLVLFFLACSGIILWCPKKWTRPTLRPILLLRPRLKGKARDFNWHNTIGFWIFPLVLTTTVTGTVMAFDWANQLFYQAFGSVPPVQRASSSGKEREKGKNEIRTNIEERKLAGIQHREESNERSQTVHQIGMQGLNDWIVTAKSKDPQWEQIGIRFPQHRSDPVEFTISHSSFYGVKPRSSLSLNPTTGEILKWEPYHEQSPGRRARMWVKYLHTGQAWGWMGQVMMAISAVGVIVLVYTGSALACRRFFGKDAEPTR